MTVESGVGRPPDGVVRYLAKGTIGHGNAIEEDGVGLAVFVQMELAGGEEITWGMNAKTARTFLDALGAHVESIEGAVAPPAKHRLRDL